MPDCEGKLVALVVDDHPSMLRFIQIGLELQGLVVVTAGSGKRALELSLSLTPDIVLLDIMMPDMDGLQVLRRLRGLSQVPIIVFSANQDAREEALRLGANDFVAKPFNTDDMFKRIRILLREAAKADKGLTES